MGFLFYPVLLKEIEMGSLIETPDKKIHTILDADDLLELVEDYMGAEVREAIIDIMNEQEEEHLDDEECIKELNDRCGELSKNHREIMEQIYDEQRSLKDLITAKDLDRGAISTVCGKLGSIIRRELNRN